MKEFLLAVRALSCSDERINEMKYAELKAGNALKMASVSFSNSPSKMKLWVFSGAVLIVKYLFLSVCFMELALEEKAFFAEIKAIIKPSKITAEYFKGSRFIGDVQINNTRSLKTDKCHVFGKSTKNQQS